VVRDGAQCRSLMRKVTRRFQQAARQFMAAGNLPQRFAFDCEAHAEEDLVPLVCMVDTVMSCHVRTIKVMQAHLDGGLRCAALGGDTRKVIALLNAGVNINATSSVSFSFPDSFSV